MDTTTPSNGVSEDTQPKEEAVAATPILQPTTVGAGREEATSEQTPSQEEEAVSEESTPSETQAADKTDAEILEWAQKKGIEIDPDNANEIKLARINLENDRRFHEANQRNVQPPEYLETTGDVNYDTIAERQNEIEAKQYVRDWFDANPDMKEHKVELAEIANQRPWLQNMDDVAAHFRADPNREQQLKREGGREALTNLAQKQSAVPPTAAASSGATTSSTRITPDNVDAVVGAHMGDTKWYETHRDEINRALAG